MTNADIILETAAWIETHLDEDLPVPAIASKAGYSLHHFTRLFAGVTGAAPKEYVLRRKLSEAARRLAGSRRRVTDVAFDCGFNDLETFTRAFKREFGLTPGAVKRGASYIYYSAAADRAATEASRSAPVSVDAAPLLEDYPPCLLAGFTIRVGEASDAVGKLWMRFAERARAIPRRREPPRMRQLATWTEDAEDWIDILVGAEMETLDALPIDLVGKALPACRCLSFIHRGSAAGIAESYRRIYADILPAMEMKPLFPFNFETYFDDAGDPYADDYRYKICVPLAII